MVFASGRASGIILRMFNSCAIFLLLWTTASGVESTVAYDEFEAPPHSYFERVPRDPFSQIKAGLESGKISLDRSSEKAFVVSLLEALDIPVSSQLLLFSTTSLQLSLISPSNPRALYFNEHTYLGWVPGGKIEIASIDPELGAIFYIFEIPRPERPIAIERSSRCMNCHAGSETAYVPGLVIKSVVPGPTGGSLDAFRIDQTGHAIPITERFGGWYMTGHGALTNHWANLIGRMSAGALTKLPLSPGERFDWNRYPVASSDILPHLIHEHQAGFINKVIEGTYRVRAAQFNARGLLTDEVKAEAASQAKTIAEYILFKDEAPLAVPVRGDSAFKQAFLNQRRPASDGSSLRDFDLDTRLFKHRCSYMIYSPVFSSMPPALKDEVFAQMKHILHGDASGSGWLQESEKKVLTKILRETLPDFPASW